jgi:hypothetical protein
MSTSIFHIPGTNEDRIVPEGQHRLCLSMGWIFLGPGPRKPKTVLPPDRKPVARKARKEPKDGME